MERYYRLSTDALYDNSDYADQVWIWENDGSTFYFDVGEVVRFRVEMEEWHDQIPNAPDLGDASGNEREPPYSIIVCLQSFHSFCALFALLRLLTLVLFGVKGSMQMAGLGPISWW